MRNPVVFRLVLLVIIIAEVYGFVAVRTALGLGTRAARWGFALSYWGLTLGLWALAIWAMSTRHARGSEFRTYLLGIPLMLLAAKIVVIFPLLLEDLTRLGRWGGAGL